MKYARVMKNKIGEIWNLDEQLMQILLSCAYSCTITKKSNFSFSFSLKISLKFLLFRKNGFYLHYYTNGILMDFFYIPETIIIWNSINDFNIYVESKIHVLMFSFSIFNVEKEKKILMLLLNFWMPLYLKFQLNLMKIQNLLYK